MKKIILIFVLILLIGSVSAIDNLAEDFSILTDEPVNGIFVGNDFRNIVEYDLNIGNIKSLSIDADFFINGPYDYARIILVDTSGKEYLVYQSDFVLKNFKNLQGICEETCVLDPIVNPEKLIIKTSEGASVYLDKINYLTEEKNLNPGVTKTNVQQNQVQFKLEELQKKNLAWTPTLIPISYMTYEEKKDYFGGDFATTCGFEFYGGTGIFMFCEEVGEGVDGEKASTDLFDWRTRHGEDWTTSVKDQSTCGSCWAFSVVGTLEGVINTYFNQHLDYNLAEQDLVSCYRVEGCDGGDPGQALAYVRDIGIVEEFCFPYEAHDASESFPSLEVYCSDKLCNNDLWSITDYGFVDSHDYELAIKSTLVDKGPLSMIGPMNVWEHAIVLIGYGYDTFGFSYWIYKNSWGASDSYGRMHINASNLEQFTGFYYIDEPILPVSESTSRLCVDNDLDGYCNWGIGTKPGVCNPDIALNEIGYDCCSSLCATEEDCDDGLGAVTTCLDESLFCGNFPILQAGEDEIFGSYYFGDEFACCGDDSEEYVAPGGGCCNSPTDTFVNGVCEPDPLINLYSGFSPLPIQENMELEINLNQDVYFNVEATAFGEFQGSCPGCTYEWYKDGVLQSEITTEYSTSFGDFGVHGVKVIVNNFGSINDESVSVLIGTKKITFDSFDQILPDLYGNYLVWEDYRNGNSDIYLYDLDLKNELQITSNSYNQRKPSIYGNEIVWEDYQYNYGGSSQSSDLNIYHLDTGIEEKLRTSDVVRTNPDIYQTKVIYEDRALLNPNIHVYDFETGIPDALTTTPSIRGNPRLYGNFAVWRDSTKGSPEIFLFNFSDGFSVAITNSLLAEFHPSIYEEKVVWQDPRNSDNDIYLYDITTGTEMQITTGNGDQKNPEIYGELIVYEDYRNGNADICLYNLSSGMESCLTYSDADQKNPVIYENYLVWEDYSSGTSDLYVLDLAGGMSSYSPEADVNSDFQNNVIDLAIVAFNQGHFLPDSNYNHLDIDGDGDIDFDDILEIVSSMF